MWGGRQQRVQGASAQEEGEFGWQERARRTCHKASEMEVNERKATPTRHGKVNGPEEGTENDGAQHHCVDKPGLIKKLWYQIQHIFDHRQVAMELRVG